MKCIFPGTLKPFALCHPVPSICMIISNSLNSLDIFYKNKLIISVFACGNIKELMWPNFGHIPV